MLIAGESGVSQQHSGTESSAAASADNDKPGEASHRERDRESETGWTEGDMKEKRGVKKWCEESEEKDGGEEGCSSSATPSLVVPGNHTARPGDRAGAPYNYVPPPLNASQPGAPCNCVSHQPAIAFKRSGVGNPDWPRPGLCLYEDLEQRHPCFRY